MFCSTLCSLRIRRSWFSVPVELPSPAFSFEDLHLGFAEDDVFAIEPADSASRWILEATAMAATAATSSMASLSLRGSSFREFNGLVAEAPSVRPAMPSLAHGVMRKPLRIEGASGEGLAGRGGVRIRLVRFGRKKLPYYRIIIASSRCRRDGRFLEIVGHYNPMADKSGVKDIQVNGDRIKYWLSVGAQPSDTVRNILYKQGVMTPVSPPESVPAAEV